MDERQERAVGGSFFGGILGGLAGIVLGASIGYAMVDPHPKDESLPLTSGFFNLAERVMRLGAVLVGAVVGGVGGAVGGAMLGAGVASKKRSALQGHNAAPTEQVDRALRVGRSEVEKLRKEDEP